MATVIAEYLIVPMRVDALWLKSDLAVVGPVADFERLPFTDGESDTHPDVVNISEEIAREPFQDQTQRLAAGVHLHWALPAALSRSFGARIASRARFLEAFRGGEGLWDHLIAIGWLEAIGDPSRYFKELRNAKGEEQETLKVDPVRWRKAAAGLRVVDLGRLATDIRTAIGMPAETFTSAQFALEMIEGVDKVRFRQQG